MATSKDDPKKLEKILLSEFKKVDEKALDEKGHEDFVLRNLALACFVLQRRYVVVNRALLTGLIGPSQIKSAKKLLESDLFKEFIVVEKEHGILFSEQFMEAVAGAYDNPEYHFGLTTPIPYFDRNVIGIKKSHAVPGYKFIEYINVLLEGLEDEPGEQPSTEALLTLLIEAFKRGINGVDGEIPYAQWPVAHIYRKDESWNFLLTVFPKRGMLDHKDVTDIVIACTTVSGNLKYDRKLDNLPTLFISPAIDSQADSDLIRQLPRIYHCWSVSVLRFFNMLHELNESPKTNKERISDNFLAIFPDNPHAKFSSREAIERLKKKCELGCFLFPIDEANPDQSGWNYKVVFEDRDNIFLQKRRTGSKLLYLLRDENNDYSHIRPNIISHNNEQYVCRVVPLTQFHNDSAKRLTEPLAFEQFRNYLKPDEIALIQRSITKYKEHLRSLEKKQ